MITLADIKSLQTTLEQQQVPKPYYIYMPGMAKPVKTTNKWLLWLFMAENNVSEDS